MRFFWALFLNLNFPSNVHTMDVDGKQVTYGYSSGTYARLNPMFDRVSLLPRQEEIDALGSGVSRKDWQKRFDLVYKMALNQNVTAAMGVTPVILSFARYIKHKYGKKPVDLWKTQAIFCNKRTQNPLQVWTNPQELLSETYQSWKCTRLLKAFLDNK